MLFVVWIVVVIHAQQRTLGIGRGNNSQRDFMAKQFRELVHVAVRRKALDLEVIDDAAAFLRLRDNAVYLGIVKFHGPVIVNAIGNGNARANKFAVDRQGFKGAAVD